ncbi:MAG: tRNA (guanosine(37)-N1)-methyltransferase TrmD [Candidatus Zixiibacteriota bacterium]|nr:tRNA (guanosine(37)-N1)-methyltransferase TrmD [candidate division Zixibacteria bacterium]MBU1470391.1 tRNA (guanosine(37)-N1)-methyltransferase TrmD [candidate division Zixibacteria bacterium]
MVIDILTIFPEMVSPALSESLLGKAVEEELLSINIHDLRDFTDDKHSTVDDAPFGGGPGMVMKVEPVYRGIKSCIERHSDLSHRIIVTSASGKRFEQRTAEELSLEKHLIVVCGRYKGIDERVMSLFDVEEFSIGDYVLTGGEFAALVMVEATARLLPGYMSKFEAAETDSFTSGLLGHPEYTRPQEFNGLEVPEVLVSGHHENIRKFRRTKSLEKTLKNRPEMLDTADLTNEDRQIISDLSTRVSE